MASVLPEHTQNLVPVLKALAHPIRLRLVSRIAGHPGGEASVCTIAAGIDVSGPTVSHHLRLLRDAGVLDCQRRGNRVFYRTRPEILAGLAELIASPVSIMSQQLKDRPEMAGDRE